MASAAVTLLQSRRDAILNQLNELASTGLGGPNVSEQGRSVDLVGWRNSLLAELKTINEQILETLRADQAAAGPFTIYSPW